MAVADTQERDTAGRMNNVEYPVPGVRPVPTTDVPVADLLEPAFATAAALASTPLAFVDAVAPDRPILFVNDAFSRLTGMADVQLVGRPLIDLFDHVMDPRTRHAITAAMSTGGGGTWEMRCRRFDWSEFPAAVVVDTIHDAARDLHYHSLTFVKLTGEAERLLDRTSEFHVLYEKAPGFIAITEGPQHRYSFANAAYRALVGSDDLLGLTVQDHLLDILGQEFLDVLDGVYRTGTPHVAEAFRVEIPDTHANVAQTRYLNFIQQPVYGADGRIVGLFCEGHDVTERHTAAISLAALQAELIHVSRINAMNAMSTTLAHELNQPLSAITNYVAGSLRLLGDTPLADIRFTRALHGISEASERAADIIRNLHELTKRRDPARVMFELRPAIEECIRLVSAAVSPEVQISTAVPPGLTMMANRVQIQQVVINLLRNAAEAGSPRARNVIAITACGDAQELTVAVSDTGNGVSSDAVAGMFTWSDSAKENGMGLGLSICRTIVEAHRGRIWLERTGSDGAEFRFSIPQSSGRTTGDYDRRSAAHWSSANS